MSVARRKRNRRPCRILEIRRQHDDLWPILREHARELVHIHPGIQHRHAHKPDVGAQEDISLSVIHRIFDRDRRTITRQDPLQKI